MGTYYHTLGRKRLPALPTRILFLDTQPEVIDGMLGPNYHRHILRCGTLVSVDYRHGLPVRRKVDRFSTAAGFASALSKAIQCRGVTWICSHNLAYDLALSGFWEIVFNQCIRISSYIIDDPPSVIRCDAGGRRLVLVDLLNYWRKPLAWTADSLGLGSAFPDPLSVSNSESVDISESHAIVVERAVSAVVSMLRDCLRGGWGPTAGSIAWSVYRAKKWGDKIRVHANEEATKLERLSYSGGRAICRASGRVDGTVTIVDVNNLYGHVMSMYQYPVRLLNLSNPNPVHLRSAIVAKRGLVARVRISAGQGEVPVKLNGRTEYSKDEAWTTLSGPDLCQCFEEGRIIDCSEMAVYKMGNPFEAFVDFWYGKRLEMRAENRRVESAVCKLITSSLYGRFAMKGKQWVSDPSEVAPHPYCVWHSPKRNGLGWQTCRALDSLCQREEISGEGNHSAVAIASFVTAHARQRMNYFRSVAGVSNIYYEDTDSLHVNNDGYNNLYNAGLIDDSKLGALKIIGRYPWARYWGVKQYELPGEMHCSGLGSMARSVSEGVWIQDRRIGLRQIPEKGPCSHVDVRSDQFTAGGG